MEPLGSPNLIELMEGRDWPVDGCEWKGWQRVQGLFERERKRRGDIRNRPKGRETDWKSRTV